MLRKTLLRYTTTKAQKALKPCFDKWHSNILNVIFVEYDASIVKYEEELYKANVALIDNEKYLHDVFKKNRVRGSKVIGEWLKKLVYSNLKTCLRTWKEFVSEHNRLEIVYKRIVKQWKYKSVIYCIHSWKDYTSTRIRMRNLVSKRLFDKSYRKLSSAIIKWKEYTQNHSVNLLHNTIDSLTNDVYNLKQIAIVKDDDYKKLEVIIEGLQTKNNLRGVSKIRKVCYRFLKTKFHQWIDNANEREKERRVLERFVNKWRLKPAVMALSEWKEYVSLRKRLRGIMKRAFSDGAHKKRVAAWTTWRSFVKQFHSDALLQTLEQQYKNIENLKNDLIAKDKAMDDLRSVVEGIYGDKKIKAFNTMSRMINGKCSIAFVTWKSFVVDEKNNERILRKFVNKIRLAGAMKCLVKWRTFADTRKMLRNLINKNIFSKSAKLLSAGFRSWRYNSQRLSSETLTSELNYLREEVKDLRIVCEKLKIDNDEQESTLVQLKAEKIASSHKAMQKFINMWQHKSLLTTYSSWKTFTTTAKNEKKVMVKFITKMCHAKLLAPFKEWIWFTETKRHNEALLAKWGARWRNRSVTATLERWKFYVRINKEENNEALQWERKVSSILKKMMNGKLLSIFNTWRETVLEIIDHRRIVTKFVKRMQLSGCMRAIGQWRDMVKTRKWLRRLMGRMLGSREVKLLTAGWTTWRLKVKEMSDNGMKRIIVALEDSLAEQRITLEAQSDQINELEEHIRSMFGDKQDKAVQVLVKMLHAQLNAAFMTWLDRVEELRRHEHIIQKTSNRIRLNSASQAMNTMKEFYKQRKFLKKFMVRMVGGRRVKMLAAGMERWKEHVHYHRHGEKEGELDKLFEELEELRAELEESQETIQMYANRYAEELMAKKDKAKKVIIRLVNGKLMAAWSAWTDSVRQEKHNEEVRLKFAKRLMFRGAAKAITLWKEVVHERKFLRRFLNRMLGGNAIASKAAAMRTWRDSVRGYREGEEKVVIEKLEGICGEQAMEIDGLKEDLEYLQSQVAQMQSEQQVHMQKAMKNFVAMWQGKGLLKVFSAWKSLVLGSQERRLLLQKVVLKWQGRLIERCLVAWRGYAKARKQERSKHVVVKEGEWQEFLRDARAITPRNSNTHRPDLRESKSMPARRQPTKSFNFDMDDSDGENSNTGGGRRGSSRAHTPTYNELVAQDALDPTDIRNMSEDALQDELLRRGLPTSGSRPALIARLTAVSDFLSPRSKSLIMRSSSALGDHGHGGHPHDDDEDLMHASINHYASELQTGPAQAARGSRIGGSTRTSTGSLRRGASSHR
jgi:hypothetical protein